MQYGTERRAVTQSAPRFLYVRICKEAASCSTQKGTGVCMCVCPSGRQETTVHRLLDEGGKSVRCPHWPARGVN